MFARKYGFLGLLLFLAVIRVIYCRAAGAEELNLQPLLAPFSDIRQTFEKSISGQFEAPESYLLMGILLGSDFLKFDRRFNDVLVSTGTIHVAVVSGYNLSVVLNLFEKFFGKSYTFTKITATLLMTLTYALISGFEPPVIRAWVMLLLSLLARFSGRNISSLYALLVSGAIIVIIIPFMASSLSFQLSFMATLGLILFSDMFSGMLHWLKIPRESYLLEDFIASLSAQLMVLPLISNKFGIINILGLLSNSVVLWVVPYITLLGFLFLAINLFNTFLVSTVVLILKIPLKFFVYVLTELSTLSSMNIYFRMSDWAMFLYYFIIVTPLVLSYFFRLHKVYKR